MSAATMTETGRRYRGLSAEERRADQRERLVRAAINEFASRGYHRTSVEDIVRSAHTSRTAFYAFFENREAAMYAALQSALRGLLDSVRDGMRTAGPDTPLIEVGVTAFVGYLVSDPAAARILLLEGIGTSPEVNDLRARVRSQVATQVRDIWAEYNPEAAASPQAAAVAVGVFGLLLESMLHLVESGRLAEAPDHVPALVTAVERMLAPAD
jgi:AcrR family transcriptional regulator